MPAAQSVLDSLSNSLATASQLENSSSSLDGVPADVETSIRYAASKLTQAAGVLLRLPQEVIAQAIVIYTKFWVGPEGGSLAVYSPKVRELIVYSRTYLEQINIQREMQKPLLTTVYV